MVVSRVISAVVIYVVDPEITTEESREFLNEQVKELEEMDMGSFELMETMEE